MSHLEGCPLADPAVRAEAAVLIADMRMALTGDSGDAEAGAGLALAEFVYGLFPA